MWYVFFGWTLSTIDAAKLLATVCKHIMKKREKGVR